MMQVIAFTIFDPKHGRIWQWDPTILRTSPDILSERHYKNTTSCGCKSVPTSQLTEFSFTNCSDIQNARQLCPVLKKKKNQVLP